MGQSQFEVLAQQTGVRLGDGRIQEDLGQPRYISVGEDLCRLSCEKSGRNQHIELFPPVKGKHAANAVENVPADTAVSRFQPAQRAVVDLGEARDRFLGQPAIVAEPHEEAAQVLARPG